MQNKLDGINVDNDQNEDPELETALCLMIGEDPAEEGQKLGQQIEQYISSCPKFGRLNTARSFIRFLILTVFLHGVGLHLAGKYWWKDIVFPNGTIEDLQDDLKMNIESNSEFFEDFDYGDFFLQIDLANNILDNKSIRIVKENYEKNVRNLEPIKNDTYRFLHEIAQISNQRYVSNRRDMSGQLYDWREEGKGPSGNCEARMKISLSLIKELRPDLEVRVQQFNGDPGIFNGEAGHIRTVVKVDGKWFHLESGVVAQFDFYKPGSLYFHAEDMIRLFAGIDVEPSEYFPLEGDVDRTGRPAKKEGNASLWSYLTGELEGDSGVSLLEGLGIVSYIEYDTSAYGSGANIEESEAAQRIEFEGPVKEEISISNIVDEQQSKNDEETNETSRDVQNPKSDNKENNEKPRDVRQSKSDDEETIEPKNSRVVEERVSQQGDQVIKTTYSKPKSYKGYPSLSEDDVYDLTMGLPNFDLLSFDGLVPSCLNPDKDEQICMTFVTDEQLKNQQLFDTGQLSESQVNLLSAINGIDTPDGKPVLKINFEDSPDYSEESFLAYLESDYVQAGIDYVIEMARINRHIDVEIHISREIEDEIRFNSALDKLFTYYSKYGIRAKKLVFGSKYEKVKNFPEFLENSAYDVHIVNPDEGLDLGLLSKNKFSPLKIVHAPEDGKVPQNGDVIPIFNPQTWQIEYTAYESRAEKFLEFYYKPLFEEQSEEISLTFARGSNMIETYFESGDNIEIYEDNTASFYQKEKSLFFIDPYAADGAQTNQSDSPEEENPAGSSYSSYSSYSSSRGSSYGAISPFPASTTEIPRIIPNDLVSINDLSAGRRDDFPLFSIQEVTLEDLIMFMESERVEKTVKTIDLDFRLIETDSDLKKIMETFPGALVSLSSVENNIDDKQLMMLVEKGDYFLRIINDNERMGLVEININEGVNQLDSDLSSSTPKGYLKNSLPPQVVEQLQEKDWFITQKMYNSWRIYKYSQIY